MKLATFSDGITKVDNKLYQVANFKVAVYYVNCPYCGDETDDITENGIIKCEKCGHEYYAEFNSGKL